MKQLATFCLISLLAGSLVAQNAPRPRTQGNQSAATAEDVQALKDALAAQQQQMAVQQEEMQQLKQQLSQVQQQLQDAQAKAEFLKSSAGQHAEALTVLRADLSEVSTNATNTAVALEDQQRTVGEMARPNQLRFRGITITPGGFIEAAGVFRNHNQNASVNSASGVFNIPIGGSANSFLSESRFDARQSRLTLTGEGNIGSTRLTGYYEVDFLGAAPTANENQSDSFNLRQRQLWASAEFKNGITFTGGQQWSLFTLARKGMTNKNEFLPMSINAQYVIGYDWARQPSLRVMKNFNNKVWLGFSVENPSTVVNAQGISIGGSATLPPIFGFNSSPNAQSPNGNFTLSNTPGATGVSTNLAPDLVAKVAFEPGWGHFEIKGMGRFFRDRFQGRNDHSAGGGIGVGAILPLVKSRLDFIAEATGGNGIGRYGSGGGFDVTLRPDASIVPVRSYHVLAGPEVHIGKNLDLYLYGGEEYYKRTYYLVNPTTSVGYGSPLLNNTGCTVEQTTSTAPSCPNQTRYAYEITPGFWYRFYKGNSGTVQWGIQYSYSKRALWAATGGAPTGTESQVYTSFRYYLP